MRRFDFLLTILLAAVSCLLLFNLFHRGVYTAHDSQVHIARISQFQQALEDGQLPVRWLDHWYFDYGYPTYVYLYSLPYYIGALASVTIEDPEIIFKLLIFLSLFLSSITFYVLARNIRFGNKHISPIAAGVGAIFYIAAPYRFADIYERGALGETLFFVFAPLLFLGSTIFPQNPLKAFLVTSISTFTLVTTHALSFAIFFPMAILYSLIYLKGKPSLILKFLLSIVFGFAMASYQWMPMIFEQKYVELHKTYFNIYEGNFISIYQLLRIPKVGVNIGTGIQLGSAQIVIILISLIYIVAKFSKKESQNMLTSREVLLIIFLLTSTVLSAFLTTDLSKQLWTSLKPLQTLIFSWRFLTYTTFATAVLAAIITQTIPKSKLKIAIVLIFIFLAIFPSRHYLKGKNWHTYDKGFYQTYTDPLKIDSYYLPKGTNQNIENLSLPQVSIIQGEGDIKTNIVKSNEIQADVRLLEDSLIQFHTIYFPGWHLFLDNQEIKIITDKKGLEGVIVASANPGVHRLTLRFEETTERAVANYTTVVSLLLLLSVLALRRLRHVS